MSFKLNMITLAMTFAATPAMAANFAVGNANTDAVNFGKYECKRCTQAQGYTGEVSVHAGYNNVDDIHAGNALGTAEDGAIGAVSGDVRYQNDEGYQAKLQAHQLGMDNGFARFSAGKSGVYSVNLDYDSIKTYQAGNVESPFWHNNGMLTPSDTMRVFDLAKQREKIGLGVELKQDLFDAYIGYSQEDKTGHQSSSLVAPNPINFGLPIDARTKQLDAGINVSGDNWLTELAYQGSYYENKMNHISLPHLYDVQAATPDNQAHQVSLSGQYQLNRTVMSGRVATGRMIQDEDLVNVSGSPLQSWDGQVDTLDGRFAISSMLTNRLRLGASFAYSDRDNQSSTAEFTQYNYNSVTGTFRQNKPQDITRHTYKLNASYRIASGYRLQAGYDRKEVERTFSDREQTHDDSLWMKLNVRAFDKFNVSIKGEHANRSGSEYEASKDTSSENNALLRKYYLADRKRNAVELTINHTPNNWISVDLTTRYANDDYHNTQIGLTEAQDYGYDLNVNLQFSKNLSGYGFGGQQWINSNQAGSQSYGSADWQADVEDQFINLGAGLNYAGLMQDKLSLGLDYNFSNSISDTYPIGSDTGVLYGDYYSYRHSASAYANYAIDEQMALKLTYRYERYFDTDAATVGVNDIPGMITLGDINHNYNAHQVMLSFTYKLH
ncbi:MtrB/PioB family decaheme-associated outer membrane protein [Shewanella maritima]|uniref:MtrB/PioB family decaheme-associated outer membrane protein n=1 Tax=Shewanella maritima TaxID=2520507 RepID=A0A411PIF6_9GAMM|nr:MtrB/PioB family decaheme-associated outer membrane protein [Shewanella maritima]QBF83381.1 MtrB/PioB family decaheme-associated outer membrane protein [Shewanella maritima]